MNRQRGLAWLFWSSLVATFFLQLLPLPDILELGRPYWLGLVLIYWALEGPERVSLGLAFGLGVVGDVIHGEILGEQSLRLLVLAFIVLRFRSRLRFFPMWQQSLAVLGLMANDRIVLLMVRAFAGDPMPPSTFWLAPATAMLLWPWLFLLLDDLRARLRLHES